MTADPNSPTYGPPNPIKPPIPPVENPGAPNGLAQPATSASGPASAAALWLHRISVLLFVFVCAVFGVFLVILPWGPKWTENPLFLAYPGVRAFVGNTFVRGVCSGLGVLDIWIGFWEAIHYHEDTVP